MVNFYGADLTSRTIELNAHVPHLAPNQSLQYSIEEREVTAKFMDGPKRLIADSAPNSAHRQIAGAFTLARKKMVSYSMVSPIRNGAELCQT